MLWIKFSLALPGDWLPNCSSDVLIFDHRLPVGSWSKGEVFLFLAGSWSHRTWHHRKQTGGKRKKNTSNFIISKVKETSTNNKNLVHQSTSIVQHPFFPTKMVVHLLYIHSFIYCFFESFIYIYAFQYVRFQPTNPPQQAPFQAGGAYIMESTWLVLGGDPKLSKGDVL